MNNDKITINLSSRICISTDFNIAALAAAAKNEWRAGHWGSPTKLDHNTSPIQSEPIPKWDVRSHHGDLRTPLGNRTFRGYIIHIQYPHYFDNM